MKSSADPDPIAMLPSSGDSIPEDRKWKRALTAGLPRLRRQRRWTQQDLADATGLHRETISRLERPAVQQADPFPQTLRALALGFNHDDLASFWAELWSAAADAPDGIWMHVSAQQYGLFTKLAQCTPEQQELVHVLIAFFRARVHLPGDEPLQDVAAVLALLKQRPRRS